MSGSSVTVDAVDPTFDSSRNTLATMRDAVFFEGDEVSRRLSRFWILLVLASIIASAGVAADSTATVIGAMIVAPLMTPILGTMLAVIIADRRNLFRCMGLVATGALAAIAIGYAVGLLMSIDISAATNAQVAARVNPRLVDLLAALATGVVGSVALVRKDISDTLPGVAIAISLVPPLAVVGLTAEAGEYGQAAGSLLLFGANVAAILTTGIIVTGVYRIHRQVDPGSTAEPPSVNRRNAIAVVAIFFILIGVPLTISSVKIGRDTKLENDVRTIAIAWSSEAGWRVANVQADDQGINIRVVGPPPLPDASALADALRADGIDTAGIVVEMVPEEIVELDAAGQ